MPARPVPMRRTCRASICPGDGVAGGFGAFGWCAEGLVGFGAVLDGCCGCVGRRSRLSISSNSLDCVWGTRPWSSSGLIFRVKACQSAVSSSGGCGLLFSGFSCLSGRELGPAGGLDFRFLPIAIMCQRAEAGQIVCRDVWSCQPMRRHRRRCRRRCRRGQRREWPSRRPVRSSGAESHRPCPASLLRR